VAVPFPHSISNNDLHLTITYISVTEFYVISLPINLSRQIILLLIARYQDKSFPIITIILSTISYLYIYLEFILLTTVCRTNLYNFVFSAI